MPSRKKGTILVADDDAEIRAILTELLQLEGYSVITAANGREVLCRVDEQDDLAVILLDLMMPEMSGWELLEHRRGDPRLRTIPVVVLSGLYDFEGVEEWNIAAFFKKPLDTESLLDVIDHCFASG